MPDEPVHELSAEGVIWCRGNPRVVGSSPAGVTTEVYLRALSASRTHSHVTPSSSRLMLTS